MKKSVIINLVFISLLLAPAPWFENANSALLLDKVVAIVNDDVITWTELMSAITSDAREYLGNISEEERQRRIKELEKPVLNSLVLAKLQIQEGRKFGIKVSGPDIESAIDDIKNKFGLDDEALERSLEAEGLTLEDYREKMKEQILLQKVINFAVRSNLAVTDKEIKEYYEKNKEEYIEKEKIRISQIFFAMPSDNSQKEILEADATQLIERINDGEDFSELAREFSEDSSSKAGGDLGYFSMGSMLKEFENALSELETGQVSQPFWSQAGLHIIKVEDRVLGGSFDKVRDRVKETLLRKAFEIKYKEWSAGLKETAHIEIKL